VRVCDTQLHSEGECELLIQWQKGFERDLHRGVCVFVWFEGGGVMLVLSYWVLPNQFIQCTQGVVAAKPPKVCLLIDAVCARLWSVLTYMCIQ